MREWNPFETVTKALGSDAPQREIMPNEIMERFLTREQEAMASKSVLEAVRVGESIVFRTGQGVVHATAFGCGMICMVFAFFLSLQALGYPSPWSWALFCGTWVLFFWIWKSGSSQGVYRGQDHFEVDTSQRQIKLLPLLLPSDRLEATLSFSEIKSFVAWTEPNGVGDEFNHIYAIDSEDKKHDLTGQMSNAELALLRNLQILGFICDKPAYHRNKQGQTILLKN